MQLDVYVHFVAAERDPRLDQILAQGAQIMAKVTDLTDLVTALDAETNAVAAKIDAEMAEIADLKAQIAAGTPVTQDQLDAVVSGLTPISDRLKALGSDPAQPIPPAA